MRSTSVITHSGFCIPGYAQGFRVRLSSRQVAMCCTVKQDTPPTVQNFKSFEPASSASAEVTASEIQLEQPRVQGGALSGVVSAIQSTIRSPIGEKLESVQPHVIAATGQLIYGVWYILGHLVLSGEGGTDPLGFAFMREVIATTFLLVLARGVEGRQRIESREDLYWVMVVGLFAFGNIGGFLLALSMLPEFTVSSSQPAVPVVCLLISVLLGKDRLNAKSVIGVVMSAIGAIMVTTASSSGGDVSLGDSSNFTVGLLCLLVSVCSYACMYIFLPRLSDKYPPLTTTAWYYSVCSIFTFLVVMQRLDFSVPSLMDQASIVTEPVTFLVLLYASLFATVFTYGSVSYASQKLSPSQLSLYNTLQPFCVAGISVAFLGKHLSAQELLGCLAIITGLFTCQSAKKAETIDESGMFGPVFLGSPWTRGLRYRARKLVEEAYGSASIQLEEKNYESQPDMAKDLLMGLQRLDTSMLPWLVTLAGVRAKRSESRAGDWNRDFLARVRRMGAGMGLKIGFGAGRRTVRMRRNSLRGRVRPQESDRRL